jgi:hypothetical protein
MVHRWTSGDAFQGIPGKAMRNVQFRLRFILFQRLAA